MLSVALLLTSYICSCQSQAIDVTPINYTDSNFVLQGFISYPDTTSTQLPAIIILPDWDGVNDYEKQRATLIASSFNYIAFAADIYGIDKHVVPDFSERISLANLYRSNTTLANSRINSAIDIITALPNVDTNKIAIIGYCFGGTLGINFAVTGEGENIAAIASFHGGLSAISEDIKTIYPKLLILSGGKDDTTSNLLELENTLNNGNATFEIDRYSNIEHAFTVFGDQRYNEWADQRSWASFYHFVRGTFDSSMQNDPPQQTNVIAIDYMDGKKALKGYLALPDTNKYTLPAPAIVILPDWDGVNEYEQLRATLLAQSGYVAFAADIFGKDLQSDLSFEQRVNLTTKYRTDTSLFVQRIQRAVDLVKERSEVDSNSVGVIGYCFGGTGVVEYVFAGKKDIVMVASFHGGLRALPDSQVTIEPYVMILSGGIDDANGNQTVLEKALNDAQADWEISRYSQVDHGFTSWSSSAYSERADVRSWESMMQVLNELMPLPEFQVIMQSTDMSAEGDSTDGIEGYKMFWMVCVMSIWMVWVV